MAVTGFQAGILRRLAARRKAIGESYVAGGVALNKLLEAPRRSRDIDLFHDTAEALASTWRGDFSTLVEQGYDVRVLRETPTFVEASVERGGERTAMQWVRDSAFRFFPLIEDDLMGLTLHPFDLATNKTLALVGRAEVRDWIDLLNCHRQIQPLGYLAWAACGKDPGYNPQSLLALAARHHYPQAEIDALDFGDMPPSAERLGVLWHEALATASVLCAALPAECAGTCVVGARAELFRGDSNELRKALRENTLHFHEGRIGGSWPRIL